jgi:hypothetical protein
MGTKKNAYMILVGKTEGKRLLGKPSSSGDDNIKFYLIEIEWGDVNWIHLAQDGDKWMVPVDTAMKLLIP